MVDPRTDCEVVPSRHALDSMNKRGLPLTDLEGMVRTGSWRPEGERAVDVRYRAWHVKLIVVPCHLIVKTVLHP